jgi:predicted DNA-binding transcriptional regulator AlpA
LTPPVPRLLGQALAAAYLGISERGFESRWRTGSMPAPMHIGRRLLWDRIALDRWVDEFFGDGNEANDFGD